MVLNRRRRRKSAGSVAEVEPMVGLWMLRMLVPLAGHRLFVQAHGFEDDRVATALGLGHWVEGAETEFDSLEELDEFYEHKGDAFDAAAVRSELRKLHQQAERRSKPELPEGLRRNVEQLTALVGLTQTDCRILEFAVMLRNDRWLDGVADSLGQLSTVHVFRTLAGVLDLPEAEVRSALGAQGALTRSGLVSLERSGASSLSCKLEVLSETFADVMISSEADPLTLLRGTVSAVPASELSLADFTHIQPSLDIVVPYLQHALDTRRKGVNVFIYGAPGTGKSQMARVLAGGLACQLLDVSGEDEDGKPADGMRRLHAYRAAQSFFASQKALIVFDEVEDVFNDGGVLFGSKSTAQVRKSWINRSLEENPVPTIWLSNDRESLDPAFIRRFDAVFELPIPPKSQREHIVKTHCSGLLDDASIARLAAVEELAPAVVSRASAVVMAVQSELGERNVADAVTHLISSTLAAQGHRPLRKDDPTRLPECYDPAWIHADADLATVARGLVASRSGRLCFYGAPGTGKTAFGRWIAQQLEVPLLVKRASDLLSPYFGDSEQRIARAFQEADKEKAVLLIDEVDGFLRCRQKAKYSWEVTLINEMLTQMESFAGVFIASTNLMDGLDQAALRRFDLKVKFDHLRIDQAWEVLRHYCKEMGFPMASGDAWTRLARLNQLTLGDFSTVLRRHRFYPVESAEMLVAALEAECKMKAEEKAKPAENLTEQ